MSNNHARLVRALVFACFFPLAIVAFAVSAKPTVASAPIKVAVMH